MAFDRFNKIYPVDDVLTWVANNSGTREKRVEMDGHLINPNSFRYQTFLHKGIICCKCGMKGDRFYKERHFANMENNGPYHFNLYGYTSDGNEVLFTKDHIVAKSLGGKDHINNLQTMCTVCNFLKRDMTVNEWDDVEINDDIYKATLGELQSDSKKFLNVYRELKKKAELYDKQVFIVPSLGRLFLAPNIDVAVKKFTGHHVALYEHTSG